MSRSIVSDFVAGLSRLWERANLALLVKGLGALVAGAWGDLPLLIQALLVLMSLDMASGILKAFATRSLSSDASLKGIAKKFMVLVVVAAAATLEPLVGGAPLASAVAGFYLAYEGISILENAAEAGLPIPQVLKDALTKYTGSMARGLGRDSDSR